MQRGLSNQFTICNVCLRWERQQLAGWRAYCATPTLRGCNRHPIEAFINCRIRAGVLQHDKYLAAIHRRRISPLQVSSAACWTATPRCAPPIKVSSAPCTWPRYKRSLLHRRSRTPEEEADGASGKSLFRPRSHPMKHFWFVGSSWAPHANTHRIQTRDTRQKETRYMRGSPSLHARATTLSTRRQACSMVAAGTRKDKQELDVTTPWRRTSLTT